MRSTHVIAVVCLIVAETTAGATPPEASAAESASTYAVHCSGCHGNNMEGGQFGPPLKGAAFAQRWKDKAGELLRYIAERMPPNAGGSLSDEQYAAVSRLISDANVETSLASAPVHALGPQPPADSVFKDRVFAAETERRQALLARISSVTPEMLRSPPRADWLNWRGTQGATGYSVLRQIDRSTVSKLRLKWAWSLSHGRNEIAPLVHDGVLFINSAHDVEALDAATGTLLWRYRREVPAEYRGPLNRVQRNLAIAGRLLFTATADRHVVALDVASGKPVWDTEIVPPSMAGVVLSSGPTVAGDVLVQGISIGAMCPGGCYAVGLDAATGKTLWRFDTIPGPDEPGGDTWNGTPDEHRTGGAIWIAPSYDPELNALYLGTGGTYDISRLLEPNPAGGNSDALYTNATIALDPATGRMRWYHQHQHREVWDLDEAFERTLVDLPVQGAVQPLLVTVGKIGVLDALDRRTGRYAFSIDLGLNNLVRAIDPSTGRRTVDPDKWPTPNTPVEICPSVQGARNWMATAYDPELRTLFVPLQDICMDYVWARPESGEERPVDSGWTLKRSASFDGHYGRIHAIDLTTRTTRWLVRTRAVPASSLLATAGGLLFTGNADRTFAALDSKTGEVLWRTRLAGMANATPITFSVDGKQYVAVTTGTGGDQSTQTLQATPELDAGAPATTLWVFGL